MTMSPARSKARTSDSGFCKKTEKQTAAMNKSGLKGRMGAFCLFRNSSIWADPQCDVHCRTQPISHSRHPRWTNYMHNRLCLWGFSVIAGWMRTDLKRSKRRILHAQNKYLLFAHVLMARPRLRVANNLASIAAGYCRWGKKRTRLRQIKENLARHQTEGSELVYTVQVETTLV